MTEKRWQSVLWSRISSFLSRRSESTARVYLYTFEEFLSWLGVEAGTDAAAAALVAVDETSAGEYLAAIAKGEGIPSRASGRKRVASATVSYKLRRLRLIYRELQWAKLVSVNPFDRLVADWRFEPCEKRPTEAITPEKVRAMLEVPDLSTWQGRRDKAFLAVLFGAGLRLQEALDLTMRDVTTERVEKKKIILLRIVRAKKTNVPITVPLPEWCNDPVLKWRAEREGHRAKHSDPFFGYDRPEGFYNHVFEPTNAWKRFKHYAEAVGLKNKSPHSARASFATYLDSLNIPLADIQLAMRHRNRAATETYIKRANPLQRAAGLKADYGLKKARKKKSKKV